jgi:WD40 repeat protein
MRSLLRLPTFQAHQEGTTSVSFSPDGAWLASGGYDCSVRLWDVETGKQKQTCPGHRRGHVAFSPDGRILVSCGLHREAIIYDTSSWQERQTLLGTSTAWGASFTPDGGRLAIIQPKMPVQLWDTQAWRVVEQIETGHPYLYALAFAPFGSLLALAFPEEGIVRILNRGFTQEIAAFSAHQPYTYGMAFAPDGTMLATAGADKTVRIWKTLDWRLEEEIVGSYPQLCVAFSPDGQCVAMGSLNGTITISSVQV